jgi:hypothetical protein
MRVLRPALLLSVALLCGCVMSNLPARQAYLGQFVGEEETDVVREMGVPNRVIETGGHRFLAYVEQRSDVLPSTGIGFYGPQWGYGGPFPAQVIQRVCETTFEIEDGKVLGFTLRGNACG